ncbi:AbrB family transcriptional regulator [Paenirhodobacter sp.]|uniref:AbrB family transcriptional regulator n=1 Tax=Paenirhodobacter sp. TaxID=1965326 RepID=UPI003D0A7EF3
MMMTTLRPLGLTLLFALIGAAVLTAVGFPAGALIGAALAVAGAAAARVAVEIPPRLRDLAFTAIGVSLGSGVDPDIGRHLAAWSLSLGFLAVSVVATLFAGAVVLRRMFGFSRETALLATAPGTMSNVIALAIEGRGQMEPIMVLQVMRLLALVLLAPPMAALFGHAPAVPPARVPMELAPLGALLAVAYVAGIVGQRFRLPAACLLAGLVLSSVVHGAGLVTGAMPQWALFLGFTLTGAVLGTRLTAVGLGAIVRMARAGGVLIVVTLATSFVFALATALATHLPLAEVWIAFAPGGVEAMAAVGLSLGFDPAYIALHHFARIVTLLIVLPIAARRAA